MKINDMYYFNEAGERGYVGTPDEPFSQGSHHSALAYSLFNRNVGIGWEFEGNDGLMKPISLRFDGRCRAVVDPKNELIVVLGVKVPVLVPPRDGAVFNPDGSVNHVVDFPGFVEHAFGANPEKFEIQGFSHVRTEQERVVLSLRFGHEWYQSRVYDASTRRWGEVVGVGRL